MTSSFFLLNFAVLLSSSYVGRGEHLLRKEGGSFIAQFIKGKKVGYLGAVNIFLHSAEKKLTAAQKKKCEIDLLFRPPFHFSPAVAIYPDPPSSSLQKRRKRQKQPPSTLRSFHAKYSSSSFLAPENVGGGSGARI